MYVAVSVCVRVCVCVCVCVTGRGLGLGLGGFVGEAGEELGRDIQRLTCTFTRNKTARDQIPPT